jgi:hypothetical protein
MPKFVLACVCAVVLLLGSIGGPVLQPAAVFATTATVSVDAALLDAASPDAGVLTTLAWGTAVSIDGEPVDGYYPVSVDGLSGWLPGEVLEIADDAPVEGVSPDAASAETGEVPSADQGPSETTDATASAPVASEAIASEPVAAEPASEPVESTGAYPDAGPSGPADVIAEAPVYGGPGPEYGLIATAPVGSSVEQTGHLVDGYVTVKFAGITGWAPLDRLGPPGSAPVAAPVEAPGDQGTDIGAGDGSDGRDEGDKGKGDKGNDRDSKNKKR